MFVADVKGSQATWVISSQHTSTWKATFCCARVIQSKIITNKKLSCCCDGRSYCTRQ